MSESANQDGEAPADEPTESSPPGLLEELLEGAASPQPAAFSPQAAAPQTSAPQALGTRVGWLVEWASGSAPTVDFPGNELGPLAARSVIPLHPTEVVEAIAERRGVMLSFEDNRPQAPIITGLLQPLILEVEADSPEFDQAELDQANQADGEAPMLATVDGRRVEIEAADEIVLRCGEASIVLRRNGRVIIRGTYVETRSRGVNRIKGGSVQIN